MRQADIKTFAREEELNMNGRKLMRYLRVNMFNAPEEYHELIGELIQEIKTKEGLAELDNGEYKYGRNSDGSACYPYVD